MTSAAKRRRAQSILEYAVVIVVIAAAIVAVAAYLKRGVQGRYRQAGDAIGAGEQYQPGVTSP